MKLSVTSFRAHSSAQKKILKYQNHLNYVSTHLSVAPNINSSSSTVSILVLFYYITMHVVIYEFDYTINIKMMIQKKNQFKLGLNRPVVNQSINRQSI